MIISNKSKSFITILFLAFGFYGCSGTREKGTSGNTELSKNEQVIIGTWKLVRRTAGTDSGSVGEAVYNWTFNADHTGSYLQDPFNSGGNTRDFKWKLNGDEIVFGNDTTYRVEEYGKDQMEWYNYRMAKTDFAHIYVLERK